MGGAATEPIGQTYLTTFLQGLRKLGWIDGQNLQLEVRWSAGDPTRMEARPMILCINAASSGDLAQGFR
jgi:hypothetical protein